MAEITEIDVRDNVDFELPELSEVKEFFPFKEMREFQDLALRKIIGAYKHGYKHVILEAPTGFGKSAIAVALAKHFKKDLGKSYIIVSSKYLQDQYLHELGVSSVKGRGNFTCIKNKKHSCDKAQCKSKLFRCHHIPLPAKAGDKTMVGKSHKRGHLYVNKGAKVCPYWKQKCDAMEHSYPLFNYEYFLYETQLVGDFGLRDLVICDEAHNIESKLMNFIGFEITQSDLEAIGVDKIYENTPTEKWIQLLGEWRDLFDERIENLEDKMSSLTPLEMEKLDDYRTKSIKCNFLMGELDTNPELWIVSTQSNFFKGRFFKKIIFKPIQVKKWTDYIFSKGKNFLLQSATIINPKTLCDSLNIKDRVLYIKVPSTFPEENRIFKFRGVGSMSRNNIESTIPKLLEEVKKIMSENPNEKGVIHTHTYSIMRKIVNNIRDMRIIYNDDGLSRDSVFEEFRDSHAPLVLVTPSAYEGVDFKDDKCRWQVLCKVPYPSLGDPQVKKRMENDQDWYTWLTSLRIVQTYGRGIRTKEDYCKTYMLDSNFRSFYYRNKKFFPDWFQAVVRWDPGLDKE